MSFVISIETPLSDDVGRLVAALNQTALELTPREFTHHLTVEQMAGPEMTLFVARENGDAVGMGALRRHPGSIGEVKRMYTMPDHQGRGIGRRILAEIEALARREGLASLVLETGNNFDAALRVYQRDGFRACGPVLDYPPSPYTAFFEKPLSNSVPA
ncbi:MAG: GNAT family N-acetyltransferase [Rhizomicrobium sp.]